MDKKTLFATVVLMGLLRPVFAVENSKLRNIMPDSYEGCPTPLNKLLYIIKPEIKFHSETKIYEYRYDVQILKNSLQGLGNFWFQGDGIKLTGNPKGWSCSMLSESSWKYFHYSCGNVVSAPLPKGEQDHGQIPPPLYPVNSGMSAVFSMESPNPPGPVMVYIGSEGPLPELKNGNASMCPADSIGGLSNTAILDSMPGPLNAQQLKIELLATEIKNVIDMNQSKVKIGIPQTKEFDPTTIDMVSIHFGVEQASPVPGSIESIQKRGEKLLSMTFNLEQSGIHCQDKAVFLTAKTKSGQNLQGFIPISVQNCKMKLLPFGESD